MKRKKIIGYLALLLEMAAVWAVLHSLTFGEGIEYDEAYTFWMVTKHSFREILSVTAADVHPPLYYFLCKVAVILMGEQLHVLSVVSTIAVMATLLLNVLYGVRFWGFRAVAVLNPAFALAPYLLNYNVESRMYPLMDLFVIGAIWSAYSLYRKETVSGWVALTLFGIGGVYTQYFALLPIVICYLWLGCASLFRRKYKNIGQLVLCSVISSVAYLPWLTVLINTLGRKELKEQNRYDFTLIEFLEETFASNLKYSVAMAGILILAGWIVLIAFRKKFRTE